MNCHISIFKQNKGGGGSGEGKTNGLMHQSFVTTAPPPPPHLRGWAGDSGANVWGSDLLSSPTVPTLISSNTHRWNLLLQRAGLWLSAGPCNAELLAGLWWMKSRCPANYQRWGAVVTNDWCIMHIALKYEPRHDKTNKVTVRPAKTQISLGICPVWSESPLSAWRKLGSLATH